MINVRHETRRIINAELHAKIVHMHDVEKISFFNIALDLGFNQSTIVRAYRSPAEKFTKPRPGIIPDEVWKRIGELVALGTMKTSQIARECGVSSYFVQRYNNPGRKRNRKITKDVQPWGSEPEKRYVPASYNVADRFRNPFGRNPMDLVRAGR